MTGGEFEIRTESYDGIAIDPGNGKTSAASGVRVRYRIYGGRGRWESFVLCGKFDRKALPEIVATFERKRRERAEAYRAEMKARRAARRKARP